MDYRSASDKEKASVALSSIAGAVLITSLKLVVGLSTGSLGILSEAMHSGLDLIAAIITFIAVRLSSLPADRTHRYGHGKIENFSALIETLLLLITCYWIIQEGIDRLVHGGRHIDVTFWSFFVIMTSMAVDYSRSKALSTVAKKHRSQALEADALHFKTDIWSSAVVLVGLILTLLNAPVADSIAAIIVALIVVYVSIQLGKRTIDELLDRAPSGIERQIREIVGNIPGVESVQEVRVRNSGPLLFVDFRLGIRRATPFELADQLVHRAEEAIHRSLPNADVVIHPDPVETDDESISEKVRLMMLREGLSVHDVQVFRVEGKYQVEFQLEFLKQEDFQHVHAIVDGFEQRIKKEIPDVGWVVVHIEESREEVLDSVDVTPWTQDLAHRLQQIARMEPDVHDCTILSVLDVSGQYYVSMNVIVYNGLSLERVHAISTILENRMMVEVPGLKEVHIHTEPAS